MVEMWMLSWQEEKLKLVHIYTRTECFYSEVNTWTNKIYKFNYLVKKKKMMEWECALHFLLHQNTDSTDSLIQTKAVM